MSVTDEELSRNS